MAFLQPTVLEDTDLESFVQYVLDNHGPSSTLIVCSSKDAFIQHLQASISASTADEQPCNTNAEEDDSNPAKQKQHRWTISTLRLLASAQTLEIAFCEDVTHFRAYLAAYPHRGHHLDQNAIAEPQSTSSKTPFLAILNLIALHRDTSAFSAQGLNRSFSIAVDAAYASGSKILVAECAVPIAQRGQVQDHAMDDAENGGATAASPERTIVWDEEVSILNVATKTFGAGERGWVGRTVKLRSVAERWCAFEKSKRSTD